MVLSRRKFTRDFKIAALRQLQAGASIAEVARSFEIHPSVLQRWRRDFQESPERAFPGLGKKRAEESRVAELERKVGQQALEIDFLKRCLQRIEEQRMLQALTGKPLSTNRFGRK
jgi:transposase